MSTPPAPTRVDLGTVVSVHAGAEHSFGKEARPDIRLVAGFGVEGDVHGGATVRHRSRVAKDPYQPNLRQVHLIAEELFGELGEQGFTVGPGDLGENVTTSGIDLLDLPTGALLRIGDDALVAVTGTRNPCRQIEKFQTGLLAAVVDRAPDGSVIRKAGVMGVVVQGGPVRPGDPIAVAYPPPPWEPLDRV